MSAKWTQWHLRAKEAKANSAEKLPDVEIAEAVSALLEAEGKSPVKRAVVNHWFNGRRDPSLSEFFALCAVLKADAKAVLFGDPDKRLASVTDLVTKAERQILDGYRLADEKTKRQMLWLAEQEIENFGKRSGENAL